MAIELTTLYTVNLSRPLRFSICFCVSDVGKKGGGEEPDTQCQRPLYCNYSSPYRFTRTRVKGSFFGSDKVSREKGLTPFRMNVVPLQVDNFTKVGDFILLTKLKDNFTPLVSFYTSTSLNP